MLFNLHNILAIVSIFGLQQLLTSFLHALQFAVEAVSNFLKRILNLVDSDFVLKGLIGPLLNCYDTFIYVRLYLSHNVNLQR